MGKTLTRSPLRWIHHRVDELKRQRDPYASTSAPFMATKRKIHLRLHKNFTVIPYSLGFKQTALLPTERNNSYPSLVMILPTCPSHRRKRRPLLIRNTLSRRNDEIPVFKRNSTQASSIFTRQVTITSVSLFLILCIYQPKDSSFSQSHITHPHSTIIYPLGPQILPC